MSGAPTPGRSDPDVLGEAIDRLAREGLREDIGAADWTSRWTIPPDATARAEIRAKARCVVSGLDAAARVFELVDPSLFLAPACPDGDIREPGELLLEIRGSARAILMAERTALNILAHLSGIATTTRAFVDAVEGTGATVLDTRKILPGWRLLAKRAVRHGGGRNHRFGLHDGVLAKENHIAAAGGIGAALDRIARANRAGLPVEIEVTSLEEFDEACSRRPDRILLDNMPLEAMAEAVRRVHRRGQGGGWRPELEASGNVRLENVRAIAGTGVDFISIGSLTHSAPAADLSLRILA